MDFMMIFFRCYLKSYLVLPKKLALVHLETNVDTEEKNKLGQKVEFHSFAKLFAENLFCKIKLTLFFLFFLHDPRVDILARLVVQGMWGGGGGAALTRVYTYPYSFPPLPSHLL